VAACGGKFARVVGPAVDFFGDVLNFFRVFERWDHDAGAAG
jgi:hypothetical protein